MQHTYAQVPAVAHMDFRKPRWVRILQMIAAVLLLALQLMLLALTVGAISIGSMVATLLLALLSGVMLPISRYMVREARASWRWRLQIEGNQLVLKLPAYRSQVHVTPADQRTVHCSDIVRILTREESYRNVGMVNAIRVFALELINGERIFIGEDRSQGTSQATHYTADAVAAVQRAWDTPVTELPAAQGKSGYLGILGCVAPDWDDAGMSESEQLEFDRDKSKTNQILGYISLLVLVLIAVQNVV